MRLAIDFQDGFWYVLQYDANTGEYLGKIGPFRSYQLTRTFMKEYSND